MGNPLLIYTPVPLASLVCDILKACKYLLFGKDYLEYLASWLGGVLVTEPGTLPPALSPQPPAPPPSGSRKMVPRKPTSPGGASFLKTMEEVVVDGQGTCLLRGARWTSPAATAMLVPGPPSSDAGPHQEVGCLNPPPRFSYPLPSPWAHRLLSPESLVLACRRRHLWFWILLSG